MKQALSRINYTLNEASNKRQKVVETIIKSCGCPCLCRRLIINETMRFIFRIIAEDRKWSKAGFLIRMRVDKLPHNSKRTCLRYYLLIMMDSWCHIRTDSPNKCKLPLKWLSSLPVCVLETCSAGTNNWNKASCRYLTTTEHTQSATRRSWSTHHSLMTCRGLIICMQWQWLLHWVKSKDYQRQIVPLIIYNIHN